ncbi:MAG: hypothetical protein IPK25_07930 [Saprospiraceae bacterium]|nr:hypothetical protein [Saprospiraceae bacterium]
MKTKIFSILTFAGLMVTSLSSAFANVNPGAACGCPALASRTTVNISTLTNAAGDFTAKNTILDCSKTYVLDNNNANTTGKYYVGKGKTITIQPGTVIKGMPETTPGTSRNGEFLLFQEVQKLLQRVQNLVQSSSQVRLMSMLMVVMELPTKENGEEL